MTIGQYILEDHEPVEVHDLKVWGRWMQSANRRVGDDLIGEVRVSTVFLGVDHNFCDGGPPLLFETMIFGGPHDQYQERCSTWQQAEAMHQRAIAMLRKEEQ
jgi:hypothetical protein